MTQEIFEILQKYDKQFRTIRDSQFCRIPSRTALEELNDCYRTIFGHSSKLLNGCSSCIFEGLRHLSQEYFKEVQRQSEPKVVTDSVSEIKTKKKNNRSQKNTQKDG